MNRFAAPRWVLFLICSLALLGQAQVSWSQESDSDLRRENDELTTRVQDLQSELDAANREIETLRERIERLEAQLAAARRAAVPPPATRPTPEPERVTVDETKPHASPRALFKALMESYSQATSDMDPGRAGSPNRRAYVKKLESWKGAVDRQFRGPITWHVRVVDARNIDINRDRAREIVVTLLAVDPETDVRLGGPFDVRLSRTLAERIDRLEDRGELDVLVLRGTILPDIRINEQRTERGSFDNPPFIGPFAEMLYRIEVKSLMPVEEDREQPPASTQPTAPEQPSREDR